MGGTMSKRQGNNIKGVFARELGTITAIVNNLLNDEGTAFVRSNYNFLNEDVCKSHMMVLNSSLSKHLKVHLENATEYIFIPQQGCFPDQQNNNNDTKKSSVCKLVTSYYKRILQILSMIRLVYDLERNGDMSLAGITWRNIVYDPQSKLYVVAYCDMPQKVPGQNEFVDFSKLAGFEAFVNFLPGLEKTRFLLQFQRALDASFDVRFEQCLSTPGNQKCQSGEFEDYLTSMAQNVDFNMRVPAHNAIFRHDICGQPEKFLVGKSAPASRTIEQLKNQYIRNINAVTNLGMKLVSMDSKSGNFVLRDLTSTELDGIENDCKHTIAQFYIDGITSYQRLIKELMHTRTYVRTSRNIITNHNNSDDL